jgi:5'-nucleotidase
MIKILLSNDDGISAKGLRVLTERLSQEADLDVYVVAPDRERSATGHALTLHKPIRVEEVHMPGAKAAWATTGTPSDCVKFAVGALLQEAPALVVSGINSGANLGTEVLYSGTVSAAMEGAILDLPSIAVSVVGRAEKRYDAAAEFISRLVKIMPESGLSSRTLLNVNVPNIPFADIKGVRLTELSVRAYNDYYEKRVDPRGKVYYWLAGEAIEEGESELSDVWAVNHGFVSITPIAFNMTDRPTMEKMQHWSTLLNLVSQAADKTVSAKAPESGESLESAKHKD